MGGYQVAVHASCLIPWKLFQQVRGMVRIPKADEIFFELLMQQMESNLSVNEGMGPLDA